MEVDSDVKELSLLFGTLTEHVRNEHHFGCTSLKDGLQLFRGVKLEKAPNSIWGQGWGSGVVHSMPPKMLPHNTKKIPRNFFSLWGFTWPGTP